MPAWCASASMRWCARRVDDPERSVLAGAHRRRGAFRPIRPGWSRRPTPCRCLADAARCWCRMSSRHNIAVRRSRCCWRRRRAIAASSSRPAICARTRRCARCARRRRPRPPLPCYADNEAALGRLIDDEMRAADLDDCAGRARGAARPARRRPARLAQRGAQARALRARQRRASSSPMCMAVVSDASDMALDGVLDAAFAGKTAECRDRIRQGARRRLLAGGDHLGGDPPCRQPAQDAACRRRRRLARMRDEARRAAGAFHAARSWSATRCAPGRRRGSCAPCSSWRKLRSTPAATRRSPKRSRSARCCRSR